MKKQRLKFKKLMNQYRSLFYELQFIEEVLLDGHQEFEIYYREYCKNNEIDRVKLNEQHSTKVDSVFSDSTGVTENLKKRDPENQFDSKSLFRQIAKKFHPDVIMVDDPRKQEYEEAFKKATGAISDGRWGDLFDIADQYNLNLEDYDEINNSLLKDIERINSDIGHKKNMYAWLLSECGEDINCKDNVIKRFLNHLFNI